MARCTTCGPGPGESTCQCAFSIFGTQSQTFITGRGDADDPIVLDFLNTSWTNFPNTYVNGWSAYAGPDYDPPQWRYLWGGYLVQFRGRLLHAAAFVKGQTILTGINTNIRPDRVKHLMAASGNASGDNGAISVTPAGALTCEVASTIGSAFIQLDGMHYEAAP